MSDHTTGVRALRSQFRQQAQDAARRRALEQSARALADESRLPLALDALLEEAMTLVLADAGLILASDGSGLEVAASRGRVLPVGARLLAAGRLGELLRGGPQPVLVSHQRSRFQVNQELPATLELVMPARLGGRTLGLLVLLQETASERPDSEQLATVQALATLACAGIGSRQPVRARTQRREGSEQLARLTPREQQVLALLPRGLSNAEIGVALGIATGTAKVHVERLLHKLGVNHRTLAAVKAVEWGLRP